LTLTKTFVKFACMKRVLPNPTPAELAILNVLWQLGQATVRSTHNELVRQADEATGYSTTLKLLQVMTSKGLVTREDSVRPQIYRATESREATETKLLKDLRKRAFGGSARRMVMCALGAEDISARDLERIDKLLSSLQGEK